MGRHTRKAFLKLVWGTAREPAERPGARWGGVGKGRIARGDPPLAVLRYPGPPGFPPGLCSPMFPLRDPYDPCDPCGPF